MKLINTATLEVKKSKFIAYHYEITDVSDAEIVIKELKFEHKKAKQFPYAYKINNLTKKSDDTEPKGAAAMSIYNIIERKRLDNILIIVVRYFGGVKLGRGNLFRSYSNAANMLFIDK